MSLNLYTYCLNNPLVYWDPTGHWVQGDENLNDEAKAKVIALTNAYYAATTPEERKAIQDQAIAIRGNTANYKPKVTPISIEVGKAVTDIVDTAVNKRGWMTADEWNSVTNKLGVTSATETTYNVDQAGVHKDSNVVTSFGRTI